MSVARFPYLDPALSCDARTADLLARMSLEEKLAQLLCIWDAKAALLDAERQLDPAKLAAAYAQGVGQVARPSDAKGEGVASVQNGRDAPATAALTAAFQRDARERTRLGIPVLFHEEGLHGYAAVGATCFPQALALASSWDSELVREVNAVTAAEMRARGVHLALNPVLDIARDARWGRIEETFGEDPHLVAEMGAAAVLGLQGEPSPDGRLPPDKVFATLKHLVGHSQPEAGINVGPAPIAERELREQFLLPFEQVIRRTRPGALMASYNEVDGQPSHANRWLLDDVLRGEWGFDGVVLADYFALEQLHSLHGVAADLDEAAARALAAGVDSDLPNGRTYQRLGALLRDARVSEALLDRAVRRVLRLKLRAGLFDAPDADPAQAAARTHTAAAQQLALRAAERSIVLLKNDGVLPLQPGLRIAVVGPNAAVARLGAYCGEPPHAVSLLEGLRARFGGAVRHAEGVRLSLGQDGWGDDVQLAPPDMNAPLLAEAEALARQSEVVVLAVGDDDRTCREAWAAHHLGDRAELGLPGQQQALFDRLVATGKPVVVVLIHGRPVAEPRLYEQAAAVVEAWTLGQAGGTALARMLAGDVNPGGKLPLSLPRGVGQLPCHYNHKPSARRGYLFADVRAQYPFGHGLSYTRFSLSAPRLSAPSMACDGSVQVCVDVLNLGERDGDEVVQLYVRPLRPSVTQPVLALKGFQRVHLVAGQGCTVRLSLRAEQLALWNEAMQRVVEPGAYELLTGPDSQTLQAVRLFLEPGP